MAYYNAKGQTRVNWGSGGPPYARNASQEERNAAVRAVTQGHYARNTALTQGYEHATGQYGGPKGTARNIRAFIGQWGQRKSRKSRKSRK